MDADSDDEEEDDEANIDDNGEEEEEKGNMELTRLKGHLYDFTTNI